MIQSAAYKLEQRVQCGRKGKASQLLRDRLTPAASKKGNREPDAPKGYAQKSITGLR